MTVPTLLDFWITSATVSTPCGWASLIVAPLIVMWPGAVWITVSGVTRPVSIAQAGDEGLHRRAGLEDVGQGAVAQLRAGQVAPLAGLVARVVGQRQHLAGLHVEHDHAAGLGLVLGHRVAHALVGEELDLGVDRELDVAGRRPASPVSPMSSTTRPRRSLTTHARAVAALQVLVQRELDALLAAVLDVGEADHVRRRLALGVLAPVLAELVDALELERAHRVGQRLVDLALAARRSSAVAELRVELGAASCRAPCARRARDAGSGSMSFGIAHSDGTDTLAARISPLRSVMRPRLAGSSIVRA